MSTKGPIVKRTIKKEEGKEEDHAKKQETDEGKGAKKKADLKPKPAAKIDTKKKERTKSESDSKLKARSTSQSRWKTLNNNLPAKVNKKVEGQGKGKRESTTTEEDKEGNDKTLKVRTNPKSRSISRNRRRSSPEKKKQVEKFELEIKGKKLQKPPPVSDKEKMDLLFAAYCNWGTEGENVEENGISAYQLTRWLKNVNLLRPKVNELIRLTSDFDTTMVLTDITNTDIYSYFVPLIY